MICKQYEKNIMKNANLNTERKSGLEVLYPSLPCDSSFMEARLEIIRFSEHGSRERLHPLHLSQ